MSFLNQSVFQERASVATVEKHPLLKECGVPPNVKQAYLQGCVVAVLERDDGKVTDVARQEITQLGLSLEMPNEDILEAISIVSQANSSEAQKELLCELFSILQGDKYPCFFMKDFEGLLTKDGRDLANIRQTLDHFGSSLMGNVCDWRAKIKQQELAEKQALIRAKVYKQGDTRTITLPGGATMELIYCAPGEFTMGCPICDLKKGCEESNTYYVEKDYDEDVHKVKLTKGFWMGRYPVTIGQWRSVVESSASGLDRIFSFASTDENFRDWQITKNRIGDLNDKKPVVYVTWIQCHNFVNAISRWLGLQVRLPTEAEWEYVCRSGGNVNIFENVREQANIVQRARFAGILGSAMGLDDRFWEEVGSPREVGLGLQNGWGFYDMLGNVREWCADVYDRLGTCEVVDPHGPLSGHVRVCRGASAGFSPIDCRPSKRSKEAEENCDLIGLRLVFDTVDVVEELEIKKESTETCAKMPEWSLADALKKLQDIKSEIVRRYGEETVKLYVYVAASVGVVLFTGCCIRWWLATILAGIATARLGAVVNHGGLECLLPMASIVIAIILFFMGV